MTEPLRTDLTSATPRSEHPDQHNEINRRFIALEKSGGAKGPPGASSTVFDYVLSSSLALPPATGQARSDNTGAAAMTKLHLSQATEAGLAIKPMLLHIAAGDEMLVQDSGDPEVWARYSVTAAAIDNGTYVTVPVSYLDGTVNAGSKNQDVLIFHRSASVALIPGDGLSASGATWNVGGTTDRISAGPDAVDIASTYTGQTSITTLGTVTAGKWNADAIPVAYGGTGATDAATARTNLGIVAGGGGSGGAVSAFKWGVDF